ncbi:tetraspanin-13 isoform X1 [Cricetulus griseus]|uniref:tetraspanin-13 isoform X1 n=1 Tax=Cricetulus griseus TaxID=10029 RepID=UPI000F740F56|nr:tetraspanin-13 isoform X1 [Cricetulus griseus]
MEALAPRPALCSRSLCHPLRSRIPPQDSIPVPPAIWSVIGGWRTARVWRTVLRDSVACCGLGGLWMARFWLPSERCGLNGGLQASSQDIRGFRIAVQTTTGWLVRSLVSLLLIGIAAWGIGFGLISSLRVVGVVIAVGIFLFLIALVGLIGAVKHHQVLLFFYMIILLLVFIVQFSVSCACLALNQDQQGQLLEVGWNNTASARNDLQRNLNCCGFRSYNPNDTCLASCNKMAHKCLPCAPIIEAYAGEVLRFVGGIGLFFSFTEILGVWLTYRYRNQKDPRANPSAFL